MALKHHDDEKESKLDACEKYQIGWLSKKRQMQGAPLLNNEAY